MVLWLTWTVALASTLLGNPTAINAVVGIPVPAAFATWAAVGFYRQDAGARRGS